MEAILIAAYAATCFVFAPTAPAAPVSIGVENLGHLSRLTARHRFIKSRYRCREFSMFSMVYDP